MVSGADDHGFDRLRVAVLARARRRPVSRVLAAAVDADQPAVSLSAAGMVSAPEAPQSMVALGRGVYWALRTQLEAHGAPAESASRAALRGARAVALELAGLSRAELVRELGVSERTVERDRELLRAVGPSALEDAELLPAVPRGGAIVGVGRAGSACVARRGAGAVGQRRSAGGVL
jgi:hypothetical protein